MLCSVVTGLALFMAAYFPPPSDEIVTFSPLKIASKQVRSNLQMRKDLKQKSAKTWMSGASRLTLENFQKLAVEHGLQKPMNLTNGIHLDARCLMTSDASMEVIRSNVDPKLNTILFDMNEGGGVSVEFKTKTSTRFMIDVTVGVLQSPKITSSLDGTTEQRQINAQTKHLVWLAEAPIGSHRFELWTSTPSFVIVQGVEILELK